MSVRRVVVVGSCNMDLSILGQRIPSPGETVIGGRFTMSGGGKGANQAIAAARQGADVVMVGRVGDDVFGRQLVDNYVRDGIRTDHVAVTREAATGVALILVDTQGENIISVAAGANGCLSPDDARAALEKVGTFGVLLLQLEIPMETVVAAAETAKRLGATVVLDPAPAAPLPAELLRHVDILTPNLGEASVLTGVETNDPDFRKTAADRLREMGVKDVILTLGTEGCYVATEGGHYHVDAHKVDACDATAAGDAFNGALAAGLARGESLREAVEGVASAAAALSVTRPGAQPSLPTAEAVRRFRESAGR